VVLANHVLEHIADEARALAEIHRVLRPGGWAMLQVPIAQKLEQTREDASAESPEARERLFGQDDHVRLYGRDYPDRLEHAGFSVELWDGHVRAGGDSCDTWLLNPRESLAIATRRE
jgi:predicted SAM-dependent methyltransferase